MPREATAASLAHLVVSDTRTGDMATVTPIRRKPYAYPSHSFTTVNDQDVDLSEYPTTALELQIFLRHLRTHAAGKFVVIVVKDLADSMNKSAPNVSLALAYLVLINVFLRGDKMGRSFTYIINPVVAFKGPSVEHERVYRLYAQPLPDPESVPRPKAKRRPKPKGAQS